jgi:hypothetical protein
VNLKAVSAQMKQLALDTGVHTIMIGIAGQNGNPIWYLEVFGEPARVIGLGELLRQHAIKFAASNLVSTPSNPSEIS